MPALSEDGGRRHKAGEAEEGSQRWQGHRGRFAAGISTRHRTLPERTGDAGDVQELRGHLGHGLTDCRSALPRYPRHAAGADGHHDSARRGRESGTVARHDPILISTACAPSGSRSPRRGGAEPATLPARSESGVTASGPFRRLAIAGSSPSVTPRPSTDHGALGAVVVNHGLASVRW